MKPTKLVLLSVFITAVIIAIIGGVTNKVLANRTTSPTVSAEQIKEFQQREAKYQQLIQQANDQLSKANAQLEALQTQVAQTQVAQTQAVQTQTQPTQAPASDTSISADKAGQIASQAAGLGETPQNAPSLVSFQGKTAYEVNFDKGMIYVDAQTGDVLFNGTVPQQITADKAAQIVTDYLGNKAVLKVDQVTINNVPLYRVILRNGTLAWVDYTGQITDVQLPAVVVHKNLGSGGGGGSPSVSAPANNMQPAASNPPAQPSTPPPSTDDNHENRGTETD